MQTFDALRSLAPSGFTAACHIRFTTPSMMFQTYPVDWITLYGQNGWVMSDPTVRWAFGNFGAIRWSDIPLPDPKDILGQAATYGLVHGVIFATGADDDRTISGIARADRPYLDSEIAEATVLVGRIHHLTDQHMGLPEGLSEALTKARILHKLH